MSNTTTNYGLYLMEGDSQPFKDWSEKMNNGSTSNIAIIDSVLGDKADLCETLVLTIAATDWTANTNTETSGAGYLYKADVVAADVTANDTAYVVLDPSSIAEARAAGLASFNDTFAGLIRFYSVSTPTASISCSAQIVANKTS